MKKGRLRHKIIQILEEEGWSLKWASQIMGVSIYEITKCCQSDYYDLPSKAVQRLAKSIGRNPMDFFEERYGDEEGL